MTLSKNDGIYSTTGFLLDDVSFWKYACVSSFDSLFMFFIIIIIIIIVEILISVIIYIET